MSIRTTAIVLGLAALAGGCTVTPRHQEVRVYQHDGPVIQERYVIRETDAYEGYYYVRIVYLNGIPWYVDEDLRARPVPRHLHSHFQDASWARSMPPSFSRDSRMRDGYDLSRIVYINGVPHHVDGDRRARPIPSKLRKRFPYEAVAFQDNGRRPGERSQAPFYRNETRPVPPATGRERDESPSYGRGNALERATERMREDARPTPPVITGRERDDSSGPMRGNALEQATGRMREETPQGPPSYGRDRQQPPVYETDDASRRGMPPARMREEAGRQDRPFDRNVGNVPTPNEEAPSVRGNGRDERRGPPPAREASSDSRQKDAENGEQRSADAVSERKNGKGRGNKQDQEETDAADERADGPAKRGRRGG